MKNSPFGKRLRASHQEADDTASPRRTTRVNPIFGVGPASSSTPGLDSRPTTGESSRIDSPADLLSAMGSGMGGGLGMPRIVREYGDRFVPSKDSGDLRTSYHLMEEGGPSTPSKNRIIPSESDALKGESPPTTSARQRD
jgi:cell division cycle 20-like protein 1 (cofactor of APC complex)